MSHFNNGLNGHELFIDDMTDVADLVILREAVCANNFSGAVHVHAPGVDLTTSKLAEWLNYRITDALASRLATVEKVLREGGLLKAGE